MNHHPHPPLSNNLNGSTYPVPVQSRTCYGDPSPAILGLNHFHGTNMDSDHGVSIQAGHELMYPSPITPIGVGVMQEEIKTEPSQQEVCDYLHNGVTGAGIHPFSGISRRQF
jgi:hypothetical protein